MRAVIMQAVHTFTTNNSDGILLLSYYDTDSRLGTYKVMLLNMRWSCFDAVFEKCLDVQLPHKSYALSPVTSSNYLATGSLIKWQTWKEQQFYGARVSSKICNDFPEIFPSFWIAVSATI